MTIPIMPGPFQFLQTGTDAYLDSKRQAEADAQRKAILKRQQEMQQIELFSQLLPFMTPSSTPEINFPGMGGPGQIPIPPAQIPAQTSFDIPGGVAEAFKSITGGVPTLRPSAGMRQQETAARIGEKTEGSVVSEAENRSRLTGAQAGSAEDSLNFFRGLNPEQLLQAKGVLPPELATLANKVALEKLQAESGDIDVQNEMRKGLMARLGNKKDPAFRNVADYVAMGGLGYLIAGLQQRGESYRMAIAGDRDKLNMLNSVTTTARQAWLQAADDWRRGFDTAIQNATFLVPEKDKERVQQEAVEAYLKDHPKPSFEAALDETLAQVGMSGDEYRRTLRKLVDLEGGPPETPAPSTAPQPHSKTEEQLLQEALASTTDPKKRQQMKDLYKQRTGKEPPSD